MPFADGLMKIKFYYSLSRMLMMLEDCRAAAWKYHKHENVAWEKSYQACVGLNLGELCIHVLQIMNIIGMEQE